MEKLYWVSRTQIVALIGALAEPFYKHELSDETKAAYLAIGKTLNENTSDTLLIRQSTAKKLGITTVFFKKAPPIL